MSDSGTVFTDSGESDGVGDDESVSRVGGKSDLKNGEGTYVRTVPKNSEGGEGGAGGRAGIANGSSSAVKQRHAC